MNETDAVSCLLCLEADEYGSMIKVSVPPGRIPPSPERVICWRCASAIRDAMRELEEAHFGRIPSRDDIEGRAEPALPAAGAAGDPEWSEGLPERAHESLVEVDRSEPENATGSSSAAPKGGVVSEKTDDSANYVRGEKRPESDPEHD